MKYEHTSHPNIKLHPDTKTYYFRFGQIEDSLKTKDWDEAVELAEFKLAEIKHTGIVALRFRIEKLAKIYIEEKAKQKDGKLKKVRRISPGTYREIDDLLNNHLLPFFGKKKLAKVTPVLWGKYCAGARVSDLRNHRKVFGAFLRWCIRRGYLLSMPDIVEIPHHEKRHRRIIKPSELKAIFEHAGGSLLLFLTLALFQGMRRKEIMTLRWENVRLDEGYLIIEGRFNKHRRARSIPAGKIVLSVLRYRQAMVKAKGLVSPWVFPNGNDPKRCAHIDGLKTAWKTCLGRAFPKAEGEPVEDITWHDLRATFEKYANKSTAHTNMQKEKFADATLDVQSRLYVTMDHEDLRGLENVVQIEDLEKVIHSRFAPSGFC